MHVCLKYSPAYIANIEYLLLQTSDNQPTICLTSGEDIGRRQFGMIMSEFDYAPEDMSTVRQLIALELYPDVADSDLPLLAFVIGVERRSHLPRGVSTGELRCAHDLLCTESPLLFRPPGLREYLAIVLLGRGHVPQSTDYGGTWWTWWPQAGCGFCQHCRQRRLLIRYPNLTGSPYLCHSCWKRAHSGSPKAALSAGVGMRMLPRQSGESLLTRRLAVMLSQVREPPGDQDPKGPPGDQDRSSPPVDPVTDGTQLTEPDE